MMLPLCMPTAVATEDRRNHAGRIALLQRVRAEFGEMAGLRLTRAQAQRLFGLRRDVCERVLDGLVREGTLTRGADGRYGSMSDNAWPEWE